MWLNILYKAIDEILFVHGLNCHVQKIENNVIEMSNGERWKVDNDGHVARID